MFEPKYPKGHLSKLIIGDKKNNIGICTLWSPPQYIIKNIKNDSFAIAGQLVTKNQGISAMIRNCLLHGAITDIVVTGADLTGTKQALKNLIIKGVDENHKIIEAENAQIEKEIPMEAINLFRENITIHESDYITNELLENLHKNRRYVNENELDFPEHEIEIPKTFPSEGILYSVREKYIADAWPEILLQIRKFGELKPSRHGEMQELHQLSVEITDEDTHNIRWNEDFTFSKEELENYYPQVCTKNPLADVEYTYGQRIFDYLGVDQINYVLDVLKKDLSSRYAYVSLWNPSIDSVSHKDQPCLTALNFLVKDGDKLNMSAWIRSNDIWGAWPSNAFALRRLQENIAKELNLKVGSLVTNSMSTHIYSNCFEDADELIKKREKRCLEKDKRGNLIIYVSEGKISVIHRDSSGNELGVYEGYNAINLINTLLNEKIIGNLPHATYIGREIQKAEIALEKGIEYKQDQKLNLLTSGGKKGYLIVLDGTDGSGKATQTKLLFERLKKEGFDVEYISFPRYGKGSATLVGDYLSGKFGKPDEVKPKVASIFYACDRYGASFKMKEWLAQGKIIICDRYVSANMGHQAGKIQNLEKRDKFLEWLNELEFEIFEIPKPDINFLLDMPTEVGQKLSETKWTSDYIQGTKRDIHEVDIDHLKHSKEAYNYVAKKFNWITINCAPDRTIDSLKTPEQIHEEILRHLKQCLGL
ncbi:MAG: thymidylate synthase [archaeon]